MYRFDNFGDSDIVVELPYLGKQHNYICCLINALQYHCKCSFEALTMIKYTHILVNRLFANTVRKLANCTHLIDNPSHYFMPMVDFVRIQ